VSTIGRYCKAYPVSELAKYPGWVDVISNDAGCPPEQDYLFVQSDLTVTTGIFVDEGIVLTHPSDDWKAFCAEILRFEIPAFARRAQQAVEPRSDGAAV
jgi:hypothetical protein